MESNQHQPGEQPAARHSRKKLLDLAQFRIGQRAYWIAFRSEARLELRAAPEWMRGEHPWMLWRYRIIPWTVPQKPPRAHPADTLAIMALCGQKPRIDPFRISDIVRSENSGTFLYTGPNGMMMPEGLLFPTKKAARREIARIAKVFAAWTGTWGDGLGGEPPQ